jgi:hypothetical protein
MSKAELILSSLGVPLDTSESAFGELRSSNDIVDDPAQLRSRIAEDGYLFLRNYLDREEVLAARAELIRRLEEGGFLDEDSNPMEAVLNPKNKNKPDNIALAADNPSLYKTVYGKRMTNFYERLLEGPVRHFDFTWIRAIGPGHGTYPHCDIVYMGRGTPNVYTAWIPIDDIPLEVGGLMILEKSHLQTQKLRKYLGRDVDKYCTNYPDAAEIESGQKTWQDWDGRLSSNPATLQQKLGCRWLTATEFRAGDVLMFGMSTVHASLDNHSNRFRLTSDVRYQLAGEPADERWIGLNPPAHAPSVKRGMVC